MTLFTSPSLVSSYSFLRVRPAQYVTVHIETTKLPIIPYYEHPLPPPPHLLISPPLLYNQRSNGSGLGLRHGGGVSQSRVVLDASRHDHNTLLLFFSVGGGQPRSLTAVSHVSDFDGVRLSLFGLL